jgi:TetR/AcrR family transcriptional regulator, cholesterol catabolism regulator
MDKNTILEAAAHIFSQKGYHAASMQEIADAVKLQKASLYHHVTGKQEILLALLDKALDLLIERISIVMNMPLQPDQKLRTAMDSYLHTLLENRHLASVLLLEHRSLEPDLRLKHIPRRNRFEELWRNIIQEGIEAGVFCDVDPSMTARALLGLMNWTITWYRPEGVFSPEEIAGQYWQMIVDGLRVRGDG